MKHRRWLPIALLAVASLVTLGVAPALNAQSAPTLTLVAPTDGAAIDGPVTVRVEHSGIRFDGTVIGKDPTPGVGHWHVNIDGKYAGLSVTNVIEIPNDAYPTITAGEHTIMVNLHENNHAATNPPVEQAIKLNFSKEVTLATNLQGPPMLAVTSPTGGTDVDGPLTVQVNHGGIKFDGTVIGKDPTPGVGHWHVNIDGKYAGLSVSNNIEIPNDAFPTIAAGQRTIVVNLHENNHALTNPPIEQTFQLNFTKDVTVGAAAPAAPGGAAAGAPASAAAGMNNPQTMPNTGLARFNAWVGLTAVGLLLLAGATALRYQNRRARRGAGERR